MENVESFEFEDFLGVLIWIIQGLGVHRVLLESFVPSVIVDFEQVLGFRAAAEGLP